MKNIAEHILDIVQNSITAQADTITISITNSERDNIYSLKITDNGSGMSAEKVNRVTDPFFTSRTTRKVGLGIPLLKQNVEITGGDFIIESEQGVGTVVKAKFVRSSIDMLPEGDIAGNIVFLIATNEQINFIFNYKTDLTEYYFEAKEIREIMDGVSLKYSEVRDGLKEMILENIKNIEK